MAVGRRCRPSGRRRALPAPPLFGVLHRGAAAVIVVTAVAVFALLGHLDRRGRLPSLNFDLVPPDTVLLPLIALLLLILLGLCARRLSRKPQADGLTDHELAIRNQAILEAVSEGIFGVNEQGVAIFANPAALKALGYRADEFIGRPPHSLIHCRLPNGSSSAAGDCAVRKVLVDNTARTLENEQFIRKDGSSFPVEYSVTPLKQGKRISGAVVVFRDITHRRQAEKEIHYRANYDLLTGLPNRNLFVERLTRGLKLARRQQSMSGLLFLDLDHFKEVNDTLGHEMGDLLLRQAAERIRSCVRETDTVGRLGGDEFVILLPQLRDADDAALIADKVIALLGQPFNLNGQDAWVGASIGIALFPGDGEEAGALLRNADLAMYQAKEAGRNIYRFYQSSMTDYVLERRSLEMDLRRAIAAGEFVLHYQPVMDLRDRRPTTLEALVRWQHPSRGLLPPGTFIPLAEETGLINEIGEWVMRECCRQIAEWHAKGHKIEVSINISGRQVPRGLPLELIRATLAEYRLPLSALKFEIAESVLFSDEPAVKEWLAAVHELGIRLTLDNFGKGYSSLSYLKQIAPEALKIDQNFIADLTGKKKDETVIAAIIAMANSLGLPVVAEGVETEEQLFWLRRLGCEYGQGFLFARPVTADELEKALWKS